MTGRPAVVVIGAGPAGLTAAYELDKAGITTTIVERDPRYVGGLARTIDYKGFRFDIGGHRFFTKIPEVERLWHELLGAELLTRPRLSRIYYDRDFFHYPLRPFEALAKVGPVMATRILASYLKAKIAPSPEETSFEQWVSNRFGRQLYSMFFKTYTEKVWGMPCTELRAEWAAQRIQNLSLGAAIKNAFSRKNGNGAIRTLIDEFLYPRLGPGQMWERCRDLLLERGHRVLMGRSVAAIHHRDGRPIGVSVRDGDGRIERLPATHVISSMPLPEAIRALEPAAPDHVVAAAGKLRFRDFLTVGLVLDAESLFPDNWIYVHSPEVQLGRIQNFKNWSPDMVPDPSKTCLGLEYFVFENEGLWAEPDQRLLELGAREVEQLRLASARDVIDGAVVRMPKAYPVYDSEFRAAVDTMRRFLTTSLPELQQIGRNGQHRYNNQDHSMWTAVLAARNVLGERHDVFEVNAEPEYHESMERAQPQRIAREPAPIRRLAPARGARPPKQLVIGLDAGEWNLVRRFCGEGALPTFQALLEQGAHGELSTTASMLPDTVWSCVYGGRNPATFDKYFYVQYDPHTGDLRHVHDDGFTQEPFWQVLADAGLAVGVVDAVKFPCSRSLGDGFMLTGFGAHATKAPRASYPPSLLDEVDASFGRHPVGDVDRMDDSARGRRDMRERLLTGVGLRGEVVRWLMGRRPWDVLFVGFSEMHQAGHFFWQGVDPRHPRHDECVREGVADTVREVYAAIDREIGTFVEAAGPDALCLVVAGHGMGPLYHASWNLPQMLDLLGYGPRPARRAPAGQRAKRSFWRSLKLAVPSDLQYRVKAALPQRWQDELLFRWYAGRRDWRGFRAFAVPNNDSCGAIRIAVRGRDRHGVVEPGAEYDAVCRDLEAAMAELRDPHTRLPLVRQITRVHEVTHGPFRDQLPDLTVLWDQSFPWSAVESPRFGRLDLTRQDARTGSHTDRGFFVASGPGIRAGAVLTGRSIYDIAPTIYRNANVAPPEDLDGAPLPIIESPVRAKAQ